MESVVINCYAGNLISGDEGRVYDLFESAWIKVPVEWATSKAALLGYRDIEEFLDDYTYDATDRWIDAAIKDGVLLGCGAGESAS